MFHLISLLHLWATVQSYHCVKIFDIIGKLFEMFGYNVCWFVDYYMYIVTRGNLGKRHLDSSEINVPVFIGVIGLCL